MKVRVEEIESADENDALPGPASVALRLVLWGSDCTDCGNTNPDSMICEECGSATHTKPLWTQT